MKDIYCDYCGEDIHNRFKMEYGDDIKLVLQEKYRERYGLREKLCEFLKFLIMFYIGVPRLCFCNQKHKDLFAKKVGLKKHKIFNSK